MAAGATPCVCDNGAVLQGAAVGSDRHAPRRALAGRGARAHPKVRREFAGIMGTVPPDLPPRPQNRHLVPAHPSNLHGLRHGAFSTNARALEPRVAELVDELSAAPHILELDGGSVETRRGQG
jgi:hypothetical protein